MKTTYEGPHCVSYMSPSISLRHIRSHTYMYIVCTEQAGSGVNASVFYRCPVRLSAETSTNLTDWHHCCAPFLQEMHGYDLKRHHYYLLPDPSQFIIHYNFSGLFNDSVQYLTLHSVEL
jgi:hypothetical protein